MSREHFKTITKHLKHGVYVETTPHGTTTYTPVQQDLITTEKGDLNPSSPVQIGVYVLAYPERLEPLVARVKDFRQTNYLPRFQLDGLPNWLGKTRIKAIVTFKAF